MAAAPRSTYRLQIRPAFDLDAAADVTGYLRDLGVDWAYLSPLLQATEGSDHGYDVVDPSRVDPARGGAEGWTGSPPRRGAAGLGILVDIVPNHMGISQPAQNPWWWDVLHARPRFALRRGVRHRLGLRRRQGARADPRRRLDEVLAAGEAHDRPGGPDLAAARASLRYCDDTSCRSPRRHPVPSRRRRSTIRASIRAILERQHWEPMFWRREAAELNYRRFFADHDPRRRPGRGAVGVRRDATPRCCAGCAKGSPTGCGSTTPTGCVDPGGYLERLAARDRRRLRAGREDPRARRASCPRGGQTDGTTGYDALGRDRPGAGRSGGRGGAGRPRCAAARRARPATVDVRRPHPRHEARRSPTRSSAPRSRGSSATLPELGRRRRRRRMPSPSCWRASRCTARTCRRAASSWTRPPPRHPLAAPISPDAIAALVPVLADPALEVARRFQQTTGPVMAKGVEDTAFYRYTRLGSLTEVGGDPSVFALSVEGFHRAQAARQAAGRTR